MSHSKKSKRGRSLYIESWNSDAKRFINTCAVCGHQGYNPTIDEDGFIHPAPDRTDHVHDVIHTELTRAFRPLPLDRLGRCKMCAARMDSE